MSLRFVFLANRCLALMVATSAALAQIPPPPGAPPPAPPSSEQAIVFSQAQLDQMLAPIALYPDPLLSQILMAATYPLEIVQAARWVNANPGRQGDEAVRAVAAQPWDPSVKSLVAFPRILALMDQRIDWTQRLGDAFIAQQAQVMDTVQALRSRARSAGSLSSGDQMRIEDRDGAIALEPANPQVVYVPYYDPMTVYGTWWWPEYPPVYWPAWPGYYVSPGISFGFAWGVGVGISAGFFFGAMDWHSHRVDVVHVNNYYYRPGRVNVAPGPWQHDADHRRGVPYRGVSVQQRYGRPAAPSVSGQRREFRGHEAPTVGRPAQPAAPMARPPTRAGAPAPAPRAFEGIRAGGPQTREFSARGHASMQPRAAAAPHSAPTHGGTPGGGGRHK